MIKNIFKTATLVALLGPAPVVAQGKFLTAAEVKPILTATKGNWIAVRKFNGQDLLYFSHLLAWRCGLSAVSYAINTEEPLIEWPLTPCNEDSPTPAAIGEDQLIYTDQPLGSISTVTVRITYDDDTTDQVTFERKFIEIP